MKFKLTKIMLTLCVGLLTIIALGSSASACLLGMYQPKEPRCLREE